MLQAYKRPPEPEVRTEKQLLGVTTYGRLTDRLRRWHRLHISPCEIEQ